jgi:NAD(P)-dependent dehydrogenase (short-subunit alcohol dehydrogenase family)
LNSERPLAGRVALVTGGSRGIGRGISLELARSGAAVVVNYRRDRQAAEGVVAEIAALGGSATAIGASLSDADDVERLGETAGRELGTIDLVVGNAGVASRGLAVTETGAEEVLRVMSTNALALHRLLAILVPPMRDTARGDIVVISSSELSHMRAHGAPYNMAKAALEALALTLAKEEIRNGIHVNIVAPGLVATEMGSRLVKAKLGLDDIASLDDDQPLGRVCRPADVATVVRFLCSADAGYVTGQRIIVDGGSDASPTGSFR